jgi:RHS repeat-associated protein
VNAYSSYTNQVTSTNARGVTATPNYDADGNVTSDGVNEYLYDAEDRICAVASTPVNGMTVLTGYIYDAAGTRVSKGMIQTWSCDPTISGFTPTNDYVLAPGGEQLTEYAMSTTNGVSAMAWLHTNVFAAGHLIATYDDTEVYFYLDDQVGTRRVQTDYAGNIKQTCSSLPYGDGETCGSTPTEHLFTGKERDTESGNDYFGARYYSSVMGRFMSPDWSAKYEPVPYAKLDNPQTLNLYAYVMNNPLTRFDPDGHACDSLWHCAQGFLNAVEVKVSASLGTQGSVQWGVAKAEYHATVVGVEGTSGLGGGNKDATVSTGVGASASASGGPLKASVSANAGAQISTTDGASASVGASGKVALGPTSASASASMDQNGAHTSVGPGAGTGKDTDWKIGGGFTAGVGAGGAVNFTQLGRAFGDMGDSISNLGGYLKDKLMPSGAPSSSGGAPGISDPQHPF